jgi:hypothetical protein
MCVASSWIITIPSFTMHGHMNNKLACSISLWRHLRIPKYVYAFRILDYSRNTVYMMRSVKYPVKRDRGCEAPFRRSDP